MAHEHVRIAVLDASPPGAEQVPARQLGRGRWELLASPLYATEVASGDIIQVLDSATGEFEIVERSGNICVQFYLGQDDADDADATAAAAEVIRAGIEPIGGRIDGTTRGLISSTVHVRAGLPTIERTFSLAAERFPGAQWQFANVYDPVYDPASGEPLLWWDLPADP